MGLAIRTLRSFANKFEMWYQTSGGQYKIADYYTGPEVKLEKIISTLSQFGGGNVTVEIDETTGLAMICLNNPQKRNAISGKMMVDLHHAVEKIEKWKSGKGLILYGAEGHFCSGGDLNFARNNCNQNAGFQMATIMSNTLHRIHNLPLITVALIEGAGALGGGAELATACDFRLASVNAAGIGFVHQRMGIIPAWGGVTWLTKTLGHQKAFDLILTSQIVTPAHGLQIGLINDILGDSQPLEAAKNWLKIRTQSAPEVIHALKMATRNAKIFSYRMALSEERRIFAPLWGGTANKIALQKNIKHTDNKLN